MAVRKAIVVGSDGLPQQLQSGDSLGTNAKFTGTLVTGALSIGTAVNVATVTVTPVVTGDVLAAGEDISIMPSAAEPSGVAVLHGRVTASNTVSVTYLAAVLVALGAQSIPIRVTALR